MFYIITQNTNKMKIQQCNQNSTTAGTRALGFFKNIKKKIIVLTNANLSALKM